MCQVYLMASKSVQTIIGVIGLSLAVGGAVAAITASIYCTKEEVADVRSELQSEVTKVQIKLEVEAGAAKVRDWQLKALSAQMQNVETRQIQTNKSLTKLLARFRLAPVTQPVMRAMPAPPTMPDLD